MQDTRNERMKQFLANQRERRYRASMKYKLKIAGRLVFVKFPYLIYRLARGKPMSKEEREAQAQSKLEETERAELMCLSSTKLDIRVQLEEGSENVMIIEKTWDDVKVVERGGAKGGRKIAPNDRLRFAFGPQMHHVDSTIATLSKTDPHVLMLSRPWDGPSTSEHMEARVWWMPQITEEETNARHDAKVRKENKLRGKVDAFDTKAEELEAQMTSKNPWERKRLVTEGEEGRGGFDEDQGRGEGLGVVGTVNLKMKMNKFRKKAHENQTGQNATSTEVENRERAYADGDWDGSTVETNGGYPAGGNKDA